MKRHKMSYIRAQLAKWRRQEGATAVTGGAPQHPSFVAQIARNIAHWERELDKRAHVIARRAKPYITLAMAA